MLTTMMTAGFRSRSFLSKASACIALSVVACSCHAEQESQGPAQRAGAKLDRAAQSTGDALQRAGKKTGEAVDRAAHATGKALQRAGKKLDPD